METTDDGLDRVIELLKDEAGLDTGRYSRSYLSRRISSRMRSVGADGYDDYLAKVDEEERGRLVSALWINVTEFFRNEDVWELVHELLPEDGEVRALSAGCSEGRETYSFSILTAEKGIDAKVEGVDIDGEAVKRAMSGRYDEVDIERLENLDFLSDINRYIREDGDGYVVTDEVRDRVGFHRSDVSDLMRSLSFDFVLCRNLLIYVNDSEKASVLEGLTEVLNEGGYLVLGKTERMPEEYDDAFETVDSRLRVYRYVGD